MNVCPEDSKMIVGESVLGDEARVRIRTHRLRTFG